MALPFEGETVESALTELIHTMGENMKINRFRVRKPAAGAVSSYIHMGGKIGVLVEFAFEKPETAEAEAFKTFAHDVALQVAAVAPICAVREDVPQETIDHEMSIYIAQAAESGKPEAIQQKMAQGRLEKFYKGVVLSEQEFIRIPSSPSTPTPSRSPARSATPSPSPASIVWPRAKSSSFALQPMP